jgi:hypothetical protein
VTAPIDVIDGEDDGGDDGEDFLYKNDRSTTSELDSQ